MKKKQSSTRAYVSDIAWIIKRAESRETNSARIIHELIQTQKDADKIDAETAGGVDNW